MWPTRIPFSSPYRFSCSFPSTFSAPQSIYSRVRYTWRTLLHPYHPHETSFAAFSLTHSLTPHIGSFASLWVEWRSQNACAYPHSRVWSIYTAAYSGDEIFQVCPLANVHNDFSYTLNVDGEHAIIESCRLQRFHDCCIFFSYSLWVICCFSITTNQELVMFIIILFRYHPTDNKIWNQE